MYQKTIINECSFKLPPKIVISDAELYKRRKENLSVLPNYVNYAIPYNWFGYVRFSKIFLDDNSCLRSIAIVLSETDVSEIISSRGISNNEKYSVKIKGITSTSDKFVIKVASDDDNWTEWNINGKVSGFIEDIKESFYGRIVIIRISLPYSIDDKEIIDAAKKLFDIDEYKFMKGLS